MRAFFAEKMNASGICTYCGRINRYAMDSFTREMHTKSRCFVCDVNHNGAVALMNRCASCGQCYCAYHSADLSGHASVQRSILQILGGIEFVAAYNSYTDCPLCKIGPSTEALVSTRVRYLCDYQPAEFIAILGDRAALLSVATCAVLNKIVARPCVSAGTAESELSDDDKDSEDYVDPFRKKVAQSY